MPLHQGINSSEPNSIKNESNNSRIGIKAFQCSTIDEHLVVHVGIDISQSEPYN